MAGDGSCGFAAMSSSSVGFSMARDYVRGGIALGLLHGSLRRDSLRDGSGWLRDRDGGGNAIAYRYSPVPLNIDQLTLHEQALSPSGSSVPLREPVGLQCALCLPHWDGCRHDGGGGLAALRPSPMALSVMLGRAHSGIACGLLRGSPYVTVRRHAALAARTTFKTLGSRLRGSARNLRQVSRRHRNNFLASLRELASGFPVTRRLPHSAPHPDVTG